MKIAVLRGAHDFQVVDEPVPSIQADELLVKVAACGVCTSELDMWEGRTNADLYPRHPGHEVSGVVEAVGPAVEKFRPGERVAVLVFERGYGEYVAVKEEFCQPAGDLPLELALAEPLACAVNAVELADLSLGDDVVVIGAGFMGNLVQKLVQLKGSRHVIVADTRPDALERALALGASHVVNVNTELLPQRVKEITSGAGADACFEVTGAQAPLVMAGEVTRMSGKIVIVGFHQGGMRQINLANWNWMAFKILNAHFRENATILSGMAKGMRLLNSRRLTMDGLVSHRYPLPEINEAFRVACEKPSGFVKATIIME